jgi:hypothetical protein
MGGGSLKGGSQKVAKPTINVQLKMEDVYIFWKVMEFFWWRKITKMETWSPLSPFITQATLACSCEKMSLCLWKQLLTLIVKKKNWYVGCWSWYLICFACVVFEVAKLQFEHDCGFKSILVKLVMTTSPKVQIPSFEMTMSTKGVGGD